MITIGFSANPELLITLNGSTAEKPSLAESLTADLTGSSVTSTRVAKSLGLKVKTTCLVGPANSFHSHLLDWTLKGNGHDVHRLDVLDETSAAAIPYDVNSADRVKVYGLKGRIILEKVGPACAELRTLIAGYDENAIVALTGFREEERLFAEVLFGRFPKGNRVMIPRPEFCPNLVSSGILREIDCLVVNEFEFGTIGCSVIEIMKDGPRIVVVTKGNKGGTCYFANNVCIEYDARCYTERESPGTGDWFMGAILAFMDYHQFSFSTVTRQDFARALNFAAEIAGLKALQPGARNGPPADQIQGLIQKA